MASRNRTEKPTPKRRKDAQEKGQAARSKDLSASIAFLSAVLVLGFGGAYYLGHLQLFLHSFWRQSLSSDLSMQAGEILLRDSILSVMKLAGPLIGLTLLIGFGTSFLQSGLLISTHNLKPNLRGLNPKNNLDRVFSKQGLFQLSKSLFLILVISYLGYLSVADFLPEFTSMALMDLGSALDLFGRFAFGLSLKVALFLTVLGVLDLLFQKYRFEQDLKQTKEEVREDYKNTEGNPLVKGRIRRLQREMARRRMMAEVARAHVVVTSPGAYAIALKYDSPQMKAPQLLAKGRGPLARRIQETAQKHHIPTHENVPLALALYQSVAVGGEIPGDLYRAVAELLAQIYKLREGNWH